MGPLLLRSLPHPLFHNMIPTPCGKKGFTLLELIIYIGISLIVLTSLLSFAWIVIQDQIKQERLEEIYSTGNFIIDKISYYEKRAANIGGGTIYIQDPGAIAFTYSSNPSITIDSYTKDVLVAGVPLTITKLRFTEGSNPALDLTSDRVNVSHFIITDLSSGATQATKINMTIESLNPSESPIYGASYSWDTTINKRSK